MIRTTRNTARLNLESDLHFLREKQNISLKKILELSQNREVYKIYFKNSSEYREFKGHVKKLRERYLPFRATDILKRALKTGDTGYYDLKDKYPENGLKAHEATLVQKDNEEALLLASRINWLHGTNSAILPMLPNTGYQLLPTGALLDLGLAPMSGEITDGGMTPGGVNQHSISAHTIKDIEECSGFAKTDSHSFTPDRLNQPGEFFQKVLTTLEKLSPNDCLWDPTLLSLFQFKQWDPTNFAFLVKEHKQGIQELINNKKSRKIFPHEEVLRALSYDTNKLTEESIKEFPLIEGICPNIFVQREDALYEFYSSIKRLHINFFNREAGMLIHSILHLKVYGKKEIAAIRKDQSDPDNVKILKEIVKDHENMDDILNEWVKPIIEGFKFREDTTYQRAKKRLETLFNEPPKAHFSEEEKKAITRPFPLLLASTKTKSSASHFKTETVVDKACFGKDIDIAFVPSAFLHVMKEWLKRHKIEGVEVYDFSLVDEIVNLPRIHSPSQVLNAKNHLSQKELIALNETLKKHVIPIYRTPYPDGTAREIHGVTHSMRATLFSHAVGTLYEAAGYTTTTTGGNLQIAVAMHDAAREDEGEDYWDEESGQMAKEVLLHLNVKEREAEQLRHGVAKKDDKHPQTLEQKIIHDADCLEINRCLYNPDTFRTSELWINKELNADEVNQLVGEAKTFIAVTEKAEIKRHIEAQSDPLATLYQILFRLALHHGKCRFLAESVYSGKKAFDHGTYYISPIEQAISHAALT